MKITCLSWTLAALFAVGSVQGQTYTTAQLNQILANLAKAPKPPVPKVQQLSSKQIEKLKAQALASKAAQASMAAPMAMESFGGGGSALMSGGESVLFIDTASDTETGTLPSWRDVRPSPVIAGYSVGLLIATNCPFELTRLEAEVTFDNTNNLTNTAMEVAFFRNTNKFNLSVFVQPEYAVSDDDETLSYGLVDLGGGHYRFFADLPPYGWGTSRVLVLRTQALTDSLPMAHLNLSTCATAVPGVTAYATDNTTTNLTQVAMPRVRVWRTMVPAQRQVSYQTFQDASFEYGWLPGYQIGVSTNLAEPMEWTASAENIWQAVANLKEGNQFFLSRPDPTND